MPKFTATVEFEVHEPYAGWELSSIEDLFEQNLGYPPWCKITRILVEHDDVEVERDEAD